MNGTGLTSIAKSNINLNDMLGGITLGNNMANAPSSDWFFVLSGGRSDTRFQLAYSIWGDAWYWRRKAGGSWSSWGKK